MAYLPCPSTPSSFSLFLQLLHCPPGRPVFHLTKPTASGSQSLKKGQQIISPSTCAPSTSGKSVAVVLSDLRRLGDPSRPRSRGLRSSLFCDLGDRGDTGGSRSPAPGDPAPPLVLMALVRASGAKLGTTEKGAGARGLVMPIITQAPAQHPAPVPPWRKDDLPYAGRRVLYTYI